MNVDTLIHQYFSSGGALCIEMFDEKNIQQVYRRLVKVLIHQPKIETSLLQAMSYCFYEILDNVLIHSGKNNGITISNYSDSEHLIQFLVADDGMGIRDSLAQNPDYRDVSESHALEYCIQDRVSDGKGMGFGLYSTARLINTAGHRLIIRSGGHTLSANGGIQIEESEIWQGTIVYFELRANQDIDPAFVVDYRTSPADEFDELFLDNHPELNNLW